MTPQQYEEELVADLARFRYDAVNFVRWAYPWGKGELTDQTGPYDWQLEVLEKVGKGALRSGALDEVFQLAVTSGHGVGKSALSAWIMNWSMATSYATRGVITANTRVQLESKTWVELQKWTRLCICSHRFEVNATVLYGKGSGGVDKEWRLDIVPWSLKNPSAFAGLHNAGNRILVLFDEAAEIQMGFGK